MDERKLTMISLEQIRRFLVIAEYMNFTKAADAMFISVSTLSKSISDMENALGLQLFHRARNGITLTEAGEIMMSNGPRILNEVERLEQELISSYHNSGSRITIGGRQLICPKLTKLYRSFSSTYPRDGFEIVKLDYGQTGRALNQGSIDLGILIDVELEGEDGNYVTYNLEECCAVAVVSPFHELADRTTITLKEVDKYRCIYCAPPNDCTLVNRPEIVNYLETFHFSHRVETEETLLTLIRTGFGVGIMPEPVAKFFCSDMIHLHFSDRIDKMHVTLFWKADNTNSALLHFLSLLQYPE